MEEFKNYLEGIDNILHKTKFASVMNWVGQNFPNLKPTIAWNQPMFTLDGTYIIGFSVSANHFSFAPEDPTLENFRHRIEKAGYVTSKKIAKIKFEDNIDYDLLKDIITDCIKQKKGSKTFWRKKDTF